MKEMKEIVGSDVCLAMILSEVEPCVTCLGSQFSVEPPICFRGMKGRLPEPNLMKRREESHES